LKAAIAIVLDIVAVGVGNYSAYTVAHVKIFDDRETLEVR